MSPVRVTRPRPGGVLGISSHGLRWNLERLGEPGSLSMTVALLYMPLGLAGPVLLDPTRIGGGYPIWIALGLVAQLILMAGFAIAGRLLHPRGSTVSSPGLTVLAILVSVIGRGLFLAIAPFALGLTTQIDWAYRIGSGALAQTGGIIVLALLVTTYRHHHRLAADLQRTRNAVERANDELTEQLQVIESAVSEQVRDSVLPVIREIDETLARIDDGASAGDVRASIARLIDDELRPLSLRLATGGDVVSPIDAPVTPASAQVPLPNRMPIRRLITPVSFAALAGIAAFSQVLRGLPMPTAAIFPVSAALIVALILVACRAVARDWAPTLWIGVVLTTLAGAMAFPASVLVMNAFGLQIPVDLVPMAVLVGAMWACLLSLYRAVNERRSATEEQLRQSISRLQLAMSVLRRRSYIAHRKLSLILHGPIQSALHAASLRLSSTEHPDAALIASIRRDIEDAVSRLDAAASPYAFLVDTLDDIAELWDGTCTVRWTMDHQTVRLLVVSPDAAMSAAEIARECVTNAIKHGGATDVWITIARAGDGVVVTSVDDGVGMSEGAQPGVGSRMLDELAVSWSRVSGGIGPNGRPGTTVEAHIAAPEPAGIPRA